MYFDYHETVYQHSTIKVSSFDENRPVRAVVKQNSILLQDKIMDLSQDHVVTVDFQLDSVTQESIEKVVE